MIDVLAPRQQVPAAGQPPRRHLPRWSAGTAGCRLRRAPATSPRLVCPDRPLLENWPGSRRCASLPRRRGLDANSFPHRAGLSRRAQAGADRRRLPGRGPGRLHRGRGPADPPRARPCSGAAVPRSATTSARRPTSSTPAATSAAAAASSSCPAAPARPSSASPPWRPEQRSTLVLTTSITAVKQWRREILDKTDLAEDQVRGVHRRSKENRPRSRWRLPDPHAPPGQNEESPHFAVRPERTGA